MSGPVQVTCHCGAVELSVHLKDGLGAARRCDCSYCRRRGTPTASVARAHLRTVKGDDNLTGRVSELVEI